MTPLLRYKRMLASRRKNGTKPVSTGTRSKFSVKRPIRKRSKAMAKKMREYNKEVAQFLVGKFCYLNRLDPHVATQVHHCNGRTGSLLMDKRFWVPVCAEHHRWIHDHPEQARERGLLCAKGQWNKPVSP